MMADVDQDLVRAVAYRTTGLALTVTGLIGAAAGVLTNLSAPDCNPYLDNGALCQLQHDIQTSEASSLLLGGIVLMLIGQVLTAMSKPKTGERAAAGEPWWRTPKRKPGHNRDDESKP